VTGKSEVDKPFPVKAASHLLQNPNAPQFVLNQVIVGGKDASDAALDLKWHLGNWKRPNHLKAHVPLSHAALYSEERILKYWAFQPIKKEFGVYEQLIRPEDRNAARDSEPVTLLDKVGFSYRANYTEHKVIFLRLTESRSTAEKVFGVISFRNVVDIA
jgi:hypothetical protein